MLFHVPPGNARALYSKSPWSKAEGAGTRARRGPYALSGPAAGTASLSVLTEHASSATHVAPGQTVAGEQPSSSQKFYLQLATPPPRAVAPFHTTPCVDSMGARGCCATERDVGTAAHASCSPSALRNVLPHRSPNSVALGATQVLAQPLAQEQLILPTLLWTQTSPCLGCHVSGNNSAHWPVGRLGVLRESKALQQAAQTCAQQQPVRGLAPSYSDRWKRAQDSHRHGVHCEGGGCVSWLTMATS